MHKQILLAALMCNIFSLSAMNEEISSSPKDAAREKFERALRSQRRETKRTANRTKKADLLNGEDLEEAPEPTTPPQNRPTLTNSKGLLKLALSSSDEEQLDEQLNDSN